MMTLVDVTGEKEIAADDSSNNSNDFSSSRDEVDNEDGDRERGCRDEMKVAMVMLSIGARRDGATVMMVAKRDKEKR